MPESQLLQLLFVYGSLVSRIAHPQGERLRLEATLIGAATLQGRLYRVSWYPGVTLSDDAADVVHGEIYRVSAATLARLDEYEGVTSGATSVASADEYVRQRCAVRDADGAPDEAWVYLYRRDTRHLAYVDDGRWQG